MINFLLNWYSQHRRLALILGVGLIGIGSFGLGLGLISQRSTLPTATPMASNVLATSQVAQPVSQKQTSQSMASRASSTGPMYVDVKGAVNQPGVYPVNERMRVADVIALAKGLRSKADRVQLNLAEKVTDQQVIYVPVKGEKVPAMHQTTPASAVGAKTASGDASTSRTQATQVHDQVNLNTANVTDLQKLAGVGQKKAEKIIEYRETHDGFKTVDDLKQVSGIGDKTLAKFRDQLTV